MLGNSRLTYVELETSLCEVESAMNHRPLTFVTEDQDDLVPLTPAMFITCLPDSDVPETELLTVGTLTKRKQNLKKLLEGLNGRFRKEYLAQLVQRGKEQKIREFRVGEVVLIERDNQKRIFWPMGRILELIPGKDGRIRVAKLKTKNGVLTRPLQRLFPLEVVPETLEMLDVPSTLARKQTDRKVTIKNGASMDKAKMQEPSSSGTGHGIGSKAAKSKKARKIELDPPPVDDREKMTKAGRRVQVPSKFKDFV